jgi:hypothetical protein
MAGWNVCGVPFVQDRQYLPQLNQMFALFRFKVSAGVASRTPRLLCGIVQRQLPQGHSANPSRYTASWLNQIEIYFSIVQRKVLTPNDFSSLSQLEQRLLDFQKHYQQTASPFQWTFTRKDLNALLAKLSTKAIAAAAA